MTFVELIKALDKEGLTVVVEGGHPKFRGNLNAARAFLARHREDLTRYRDLLAHFINTTRDDTRAAREAFAMAYETKLREEAEADLPHVPEWLAHHTWYLLIDALSGYINRGLERYTWAAVIEAVESGMRRQLEARALERWAEVQRAREAHSAALRFEDPEWVAKDEELDARAEEWAWRAWLVLLAAHNRPVAERLDPWVDIGPWVRILA
ncbi:MAG: hypothetical protein ACO2OU_02295, partial [Thermus aquaticus]|uniref:hypothetical protein n=1 Tax=Thermus aquaticus TaxID=271 RepID=UPI003C076DEC